LNAHAKIELAFFVRVQAGWSLEEYRHTSAIRYPVSGIWYPASGIRHLVSGIRHPASGIRHPASGIRHPASGIRHPASTRRLYWTGGCTAK
jgi:hypothetical protein